MSSLVAQGYKQLQLDLWSLLSGADASPYADIVFHATGTTEGQGPTSAVQRSFHAHKVIVYHTAPMLYTALLSVADAGEDQQKAPQTATVELEPHVFKLCLEFLYTGEVTASGVTQEDMVKLVSFAESYNIPGLMDAKAWKQSSGSWVLPGQDVDLLNDSNPPPPKPILAARHNPLFSDVTLLVEGQRFRAHKAILAARSAYFARMFESGLAESFQSEIAITQAPASSFGLFLDYLYSATLRGWSLLTPDAAVELIPVCHQYGATSLINSLSTGSSVVHLKAICEQRLSQVLDGDNVCLIYDIALFHDATDLAQRCGRYMRENLEEVSCSDNFAYLSDAGLAEAEQYYNRAWALAESPAQLSSEAARRLAILARIRSRQKHIAQAKQNEITTSGEAEAEAEAEANADDTVNREDAELGLIKADRLWGSLFWRAIVDLVSIGASDPATVVPMRTMALRDYLQRSNEEFEMLEFTRTLPRRRGAASSLHTTASFDLARVLDVAPAQILKEVVFFRFKPPKRKHAYKNGAYDLVLVLVNGDRMVDEHLLKQFLFGDEYQEEGRRSLIAMASLDAIFHRTGFTAPFVPPLFHRKPLLTIVDSELASSAEQFSHIYSNCGTTESGAIPLDGSAFADWAMKIRFDALMRLLPAEHVVVTSVSKAFPATPKTERICNKRP